MVSKNKKSSLSEREKMENEIRLPAFFLYEKRNANNTKGDEQSDWYTAEALIKTKHNKK